VPSYDPGLFIKIVRLGTVAIIVVLAGCSPRNGGKVEVNPASYPTPIIDPTPSHSVTPKPSRAPTFTRTPEPAATFTPTATEAPLDAETLAFVEKHGKDWEDYLQYDEERKVFRIRMAFAEFSKEVRPIYNGDGVLMGNAILSVKLEYFDGSKIQSILVPILINRGKDCMQRGMGSFPCEMFSVDTLLAAYRDDDRHGPGWDEQGIGVEFWLRGDDDPTLPGSFDRIAADYNEANGKAYQNFLNQGDPSIQMVVPVNVLTGCGPDSEILALEDPNYFCYPKLEKTPELTPAAFDFL